MKKISLIVITGIFVSGECLALTAEQQAEADRSTAIHMKARNILMEAEARAISQCDTSNFNVQVPAMDYRTKQEITRNIRVDIEWSGKCVNGMREGEGVLTWIQHREMGRPEMGMKHVMKQRGEGRLVNGQRKGLWCTTLTSDMYMKGKLNRSNEYSFCAVFASHTKPLTTGYRKEADGRWLEVQGNKPTGSSLEPGALEKMSANVLAGGKGHLVVKNKALDELVQGSRIVAEPSWDPIPFKDKRVALVLSSNMIRELELYKKKRQDLINASAGLTGKAAEVREKFIALSDPSRLMTKIAKIALRHVKSAEPADDLSGLQTGKFDYVLVLDWKHTARFDLLDRFAEEPDYTSKAYTKMTNQDYAKGLFCQSLGMFLISRELKAIRQVAPSQRCVFKRYVSHYKDPNEAYFAKLSSEFEGNWGKGPDDDGIMMIGLRYLFK